MNLPKDIICEILYFLDWKEFYKVIKYLKYDIQKQLILYDKYNNSLQNLTMDTMCYNTIEYFEIFKYLHSIGKKCTANAMNWASYRGHLETVKYLHSIGKECTPYAMDWASRFGHLEIVQYLHSIGKDCTVSAIILASNNGHLEIVEYLKLNKLNKFLF
jgi:hypothetical protein